jgi:glutamate formiminotransferase
MQQIVECVPNFSNGRSPEIYEAIVGTSRRVRLGESVNPSL